MQSIDYPMRKFRHSMMDMIKHDNFRCIYRGFVPLLIGNTYFYASTAIGRYFVTNEKYEYGGYMAGMLFMIATLMAHPFFLLSKRVQYGPYSPTKIK
jgi:hypothetical protein